MANSSTSSTLEKVVNVLIIVLPAVLSVASEIKKK